MQFLIYIYVNIEIYTYTYTHTHTLVASFIDSVGLFILELADVSSVSARQMKAESPVILMTVSQSVANV